MTILLIATPAMFLVVAAFLYYGLLPFAIKFLVGYEAAGMDGSLPMQLEARVGEYVSLIMSLIFAFGLCFELPVLLTLLAKVGLVTSEGLRQKRRYAIVLVFIVAAVITPPDVISQISLAVPILALYEISIWLARMVERKRALAEAEDAEEIDEPPSPVAKA